MTTQDLANYTRQAAGPTHVNYRGLDVYGMAAVVVRRPHGRRGAEHPVALQPVGASRGPRRCSSTSRRRGWPSPTATPTSATRDYVDVPQHGLLDPAYAATRSCLINDTALTSPVAPGNPYPPYGGCGSTRRQGTPDNEGTNTNHLVVADKWGNVVSYTNTIEQIAGSGMTVPGRGFLLNNEMTDFDFAPATPARTTRTCPRRASGRARACRRRSC